MAPITIQYPSSTELGTAFTLTPLPDQLEHTAITVKSLAVDADAIAEVGGNTQATLYMNYTIGAGTKVQIRVYGSYLSNPTSADWYTETVETDSTGVATLDNFIIELTATTTVPKTYHFFIGAYKALKVTYQAVGANQTGSALTLNLGLRTN